ncbi:MBL fold metallo-hydrolase [Brachybacterium sp. EF45031]|uniref:MBL fold metallo-hydrolase n=1 Tax=Brachybacterium sillae TaxID=2810536 RepID=UPI00217D6965|nr:MBL fold metallo-hydrolase [Brachybacterium sillae]MCS6711201.1 MBL fold metallo-hydrolase [Brachybacterium sillae]
MKIRHLRHSCLLVEAGGLRVLIDPGTFSPQAASQTDLDAVLLTHQHPDHADPDTLRSLLEANPKARVIAEPETAQELAQLVEQAPGQRIIEPLRAGEALELSGENSATLRVEAHGGRHAVIHPDIPGVGNVGYVFEARRAPADGATQGETRRLGVTGDSLEPVEAFRGIDALAFAVVAPWSKMQETIDFLREVRPVLALPVHDAVVSTEGREIYLRQSTDLAPEGTEVRDWPEDPVVEI